ncbi:hypothetical protein V6U71_11215 [Sphingopyxis sp. J-6]|uniref:hypothetical protein n=1 Tax=Sphingopyxis sp. J-6 TaxID=3122054 RepID=UPI003984555E
MRSLRILSLFVAGLAQCSFASADVVANGPFYLRYGPDGSEEDRARVLSNVIETVRLIPDGAVYLCSTASPPQHAPDVLLAMTRRSLVDNGLAGERIYIGGTCTEAVIALPLGAAPKEAVFAAIGSREWLKTIHQK